jgi:hypothetical protein
MIPKSGDRFSDQIMLPPMTSPDISAINAEILLRRSTGWTNVPPDKLGGL